MDIDGFSALAALAATWQAERAKKDVNFDIGDLSAFFDEVAPHIPGMLQQKPDAELPPISAGFDPVSQQQARNPFAEPQDIASQVIVTKHDPRLAEHLKRLAKDGGAPSYAYLHEIHEAEEARKRRRAIEYGAAEHQRNAFRDPKKLTEQSKLMGEDRELALFYRAEAQASPIRLPWQPGHKNLTLMSKLSVANPAFGPLVRQAAELLEQWTRDELAVARAAEETARRVRVETEMRLAPPVKLQ